MADGMVGSVYIAASVNEIDGISFRGHGLFFSNLDGFVKSPSAALRFILRHCDVRQVRLIPQYSRALHLELFTVPSVC
jgi:hypothetical protein